MLNIFLGLKTIKSKLAYIVAIITFIIIAILFAISSIPLRKKAIETAKDNASKQAKEYASNIKYELEKALATSLALANTFSSIKANNNPINLNRAQALTILKANLRTNKNFVRIGMAWEPNAFDNNDTLYKNKTGHDINGRFIPYCIKSNTNISFVDTLDKQELSNNYATTKVTKHEAIINPHFKTLNGKEILMISLISPIINKGKYLGAISIDISSEWIQNVLNKNPMTEKQSQVIVLANNGIITAISDKQGCIGNHILSLQRSLKNETELLQTGEKIAKLNNKVLTIQSPIFIKNTETPWAVNITIPEETIMERVSEILWHKFLISIILLICAILTILFFIKNMLNPLNDIAKAAEDVALRKFNFKKIKSAGIEIERINNAFSNVVKSLQNIASVTNSISKGDFSKSVEIKSSKDILAKSVNSMIGNLKQAKIDAKTRNEEDKKHKWETEGLAKLGEIIRQNNINIKALSFNVIDFIIKYLDANQGGLFVVNDADKTDIFIEMITCIAYNSKRKTNKRINLSEGLIGRCIDESETIYMTDIPDSYIDITSGLGNHNPGSLLIIPLKQNEETYGAIEIASFKKFEKHQITFLENVGESIAIAISTVKISAKTAALLEATQQQAEQMAVQEEEMRQSIEELEILELEAASREEMLEKNIADLKSKLTNLKDTNELQKKEIANLKISQDLSKN